MFVVTGASGRYGRLVVEALLSQGIAADEIVAAVRHPDDVRDLRNKGLLVRQADYDRPETLVPAFAGASRLLLVPTAEIGRRYAQMENAVAAAIEAKVGRIAYAGFVNGDRSTMVLGNEHRQTEGLIRRSGVRYIFLRNGPYIEPLAGEAGALSKTLATGEMFGSAGNGKFSGASRNDLAEVAAVALSSDLVGDIVFELGGTAFTMADVAHAIATRTGRPVTYHSLPVAEYGERLVNAGYPRVVAEIAADATFAAQRGDWYTESADLQTLLGRPSTPLTAVIDGMIRGN